MTEVVEELPRNKAPIYVAVGVSAAALLVIVGVAVTRLGAHTPAATGPTVTARPATTPATATTAPAAGQGTAQPATTPVNAAPAADKEVQLQIATVPPGAEVLLGSESLGASPVDVHHARAAEPLTLTIRRPGFKEERRPVALDHDQTLEIVLQPKHDRVAVHAARQQKPAQPSQQAQPQHHSTDLRNPFE
jgi:hypothetical protein